MCWPDASRSTTASAAVFGAYETERRARTAAVVERSVSTRGKAIDRAFARADTAAAHIEREWRAERVTERYDWIYRYNATAVPLRYNRYDFARTIDGRVFQWSVPDRDVEYGHHREKRPPSFGSYRSTST